MMKLAFATVLATVAAVQVDITSCDVGTNQNGYHCTEAFDGVTTGAGNGWAYAAYSHQAGMFKFDSSEYIDSINVLSGVGRNDHHLDDYEVFYTNEANPSNDVQLVTCLASNNQGGYHCNEAMDGKTRYNDHRNGWAYSAQAPADGVWIFDATHSIDKMNLLSGINRNDHHINDFDIHYSTSSSPSLNGNDWTAVSGLSFRNAVLGGSISGNTVSANGQDLLELSFDAVNARAIRLHVRGTDARNDNIVLTELQIFPSYWKPMTSMVSNQVTHHEFSACLASKNQGGYHCNEAMDGQTSGSGNGWAYSAQAPADGVWLFDGVSTHDVNQLDITSGANRNNHRINDFDVYYSTAQNPKTNVNLASCLASNNQGGYHCNEAKDGIVSRQSGNGWAYSAQAPADGVWIFDATSSINKIDLHSGIRRNDHHINDFDVYYTTSSSPSLNGNDWTAISGLSFRNAVSGGSISGNSVTTNGQDHLELSFDAVNARAVRLHVRGTDASNNNVVLTEIKVYSSEWQPMTGVSFLNSVSGGSISGNRISANGQTLIQLGFDQVSDARAIKIHVRGTDASNENVVLTEIKAFGPGVNGNHVTTNGEELTQLTFDAQMATAVMLYIRGTDASNENAVLTELSVFSSCPGGPLWSQTPCTNADMCGTGTSVHTQSCTGATNTQNCQLPACPDPSSCTVTCEIVAQTVIVTHDKSGADQFPGTADDVTHHRCYKDDTVASGCTCLCGYGSVPDRCPTPVAYNSATSYSGSSSDNYYNYCNYMVTADCGDMCADATRSRCSDECNTHTHNM